MNELELEALENIKQHCLGNGCNGHVNNVISNTGGQYRGSEFLMQLSKKVPDLFKLLYDFADPHISKEVYINAGIFSNGGWLLGYLQGCNFFEQNEFEKFLPRIIENHWDALRTWPEYANQEEWVEKAVERKGESYQFASNILKDSDDFVKRLIIKQPSCFKFATDRLRNDISLALLAVVMCEKNFKYVGHMAQQDYEICHIAIINNPTNIQYLNVSNPYFKNLSEIAIRKGVDKSYLPLKLRNPKKMFDKALFKAELNMSYGATPPRLLILKNLETEISMVKLALIIDGEFSEFTLKCNKIKGCLFNIELNNNLPDSIKFKEWQDKVSEKGALKISIKNVGIFLDF
jgi:hypothetical protein